MIGTQKRDDNTQNTQYTKTFTHVKAKEAGLTNLHPKVMQKKIGPNTNVYVCLTTNISTDSITSASKERKGTARTLWRRLSSPIIITTAAEQPCSDTPDYRMQDTIWQADYHVHWLRNNAINTKKNKKNKKDCHTWFMVQM